METRDPIILKGEIVYFTKQVKVIKLRWIFIITIFVLELGKSNLL